MPYNTYPFELPPLPFDYAALEPYIDAETMYYHHDRHFQTYVTNLNKALEPYPGLQRLTLEQLLSGKVSLPREAQTSIFNNAGGVYNHTLYFEGLTPPGSGRSVPQGKLLTLINHSYGSFESFKQTFTAQALSVFGSGWTFLTLNRNNRLNIMNVKNQDTVLPKNVSPLLTFDVWEHAYYLKYRNLRAEYLNALWNVIVFPAI